MMSHLISVCFALCCVGLSTAADPPVKEKPALKEEPLPAETEKVIRETVYGKSLVTAAPLEGKYALSEIVVVPKVIEDAYATHPQGVIQLLLRIADGAQAEHSMRAVSYLIAVAQSPAVASVVALNFDKAKYDEIDRAWRLTPRQHWIAKVKEKLAEKKEK